jgi:hypothetical protein
MKNFVIAMLVVVLLLVGIAINAKGEEASAQEVKLSEVKTFTAKGQLEGTWILSFQKDEDGYFRCGFDMGDGRVILVPLTDSEVDRLMADAVDEIRQKQEEENQKTDDRGFIAKAVDWIAFWN